MKLLKPKFKFGQTVKLPDGRLAVVSGIFYRTSQFGSGLAKLDYEAEPKYKCVGSHIYYLAKELQKTR